MVLPITLALLAVAVLIAVQSWRRGVALFAVWIVFEDLLRKFSDNPIALYLAKDALLLGVYCGFLLRRGQLTETGPRRPLLLAPLACVLGLAVAQSFNPDLGHPLVAVIGLRMTFLYVPLLFIAFHYVDSEAALARVLRAVTCFGGLAALFGLAQSVFGIALLNPAAVPAGELMSQRQTLDGSSFFRPNSLFLDSSRFGLFLFTSWFFAIGALFYETSRPRRDAWQRIAQINLLLIGGALLLNGYRAALVGTALALPFLVARRAVGGHARPLLGTLVPLAALVLLLATSFRSQIEPVLRFYGETLSPSSSSFEGVARLQLQGNNFLSSLDRSGFGGHGTGSASQGLYYLASFLWGDPYALMATEGLWSAVVWEYGVPGLLLWGWWFLALLAFEWQELRAARGTRWHGPGLALVAWTSVFLLFVCPAGMQVFQDYLSSTALWFGAGVIARLPLLAHAEAGAPPELALEAAR